MGKKITVFGSFVVDLMGRTPHLPVPGETVKGSVFKMGPGGKGFNQGVAAHKAGADVTMVTKLGTDAFAQVALGAMRELGMDESRVCLLYTSFIAVSIGDGLGEIFKGIGADYLIEGGQTMNPSTEDMLKAIEQVNADTVFIFPNNKNRCV